MITFLQTKTAPEISISIESLNILGSERLDLEYELGDWNTVIIQHSFITNPGLDHCIFYLNGCRGFFKLRYDRVDNKEFHLEEHQKSEILVM